MFVSGRLQGKWDNFADAQDKDNTGRGHLQTAGQDFLRGYT